MHLSNFLLPLALIASTAFAAPTPTLTIERLVTRAQLEKRTQVFYFPGDGSIGAGQPPDFSATKYPFFCYIPDKDIKLYFRTQQSCGSIPVQNTDPNATIA